MMSLLLLMNKDASCVVTKYIGAMFTLLSALGTEMTLAASQPAQYISPLKFNPTLNEKSFKLSSGQLFNVRTSGNQLTINTTKSGWFYQFAGIKSLTPGFSFSNCTLNINGFCLFSVSDTVAASPLLDGPAVQPELKVCLNGIGNTYSCERVTLGARFIYVVNVLTSNGVSLCAINPGGQLGSCTANPNNLFNVPFAIALNSKGTFVYLTNTTGNSVSICPINNNGTLGTCFDSGGTFDSPQGIALNPANSLAYVTNTPNNSVTICPINTNGTFGTCFDSGRTGVTLNAPQGITLNHSGSLAYVTNSGGTAVRVCPINSNGTFGACFDSGRTGATFNKPSSIVLNASGLLAYVTNSGTNLVPGTTVTICPINADGTFGDCFDSGRTGATFSRPMGIALNTAGALAYVTNYGANATGTTATICPINSNGTFGDCLDSGATFNAPGGIVLF